MALVDILFQVVAVVAVLHGVGMYTVVDPAARRGALLTVRRNVRAVVAPAVGLGGVLALNGVVRDIGVDLSWLVGLNITGSIHRLEGAFVADLQSFASTELTIYFSLVYVFGYVFLLTFPVVVYAMADDERPLRAALVAYSLNYGLGLACYVLFVAYGPRNFIPGQVEALLYTTWPQSQFLTSEVNANTNVFPSLHTSLAVTVGLLASRYRSVAPRWRPVAWLLAVSVAVSTMYLGIHWLTDVLAGVGLAAISAFVGVRLAEREPPDGRDDGWLGDLAPLRE
jgi:membrane-associated phospholipid phosphatase